MFYYQPYIEKLNYNLEGKWVVSTAKVLGFGRGRIAHTAIAMLVTLSSIALALIFLNSSKAAHASSVIEVPTQTTPWGIAFDKSGHVWVAEPGCDPAPSCGTAFPTTIGEYNVSNATLVKNYNEPSGFSSPLFLAVDGSGNIWFTELNSNAIGELIPGSSPIWNQWNVPTANLVPYDLVFDGKGNLWFTEFNGNKIGFFNKTKHTFVETATPTANSHPYGITRTSGGQIWFAENNAGKIGSFSPTKSGKVTISEHPISAQSPHLITSDKSGNIWYSEGFAGKIGEFIPGSNTSKDFNVSCSCSGIHISGIAVDSKGRIWFDDSLSARIGYYNPATSKVTTLTLSNTGAHPHDGLGLDSTGNTWFTEEFGGPTGMLGEIPAGSL
jgi:virginiamycin B lyase